HPGTDRQPPSRARRSSPRAPGRALRGTDREQSVPQADRPMTATRISVCIPTRNRAGFLAQALVSVLRQDVDGLELLVFDDASVDQTPELVAGCADERVRYVRHRTPIGVAANRNSCLQEARGRYIAWLDSDDERLPDTLARQLAILDEHPEVAVAHGGFELGDADGPRLPRWPAPLLRVWIEAGPVALRHLLAPKQCTT